MKNLYPIFIVLVLGIRLNAQVTFTSSNLPIIIINTNGGTILDEPKIMASMGIIDNGEGNRNYINNAFNNYNGKIGIEIRGHSSQMFPKKQYGLELWDSVGNEIKAGLLGMPEGTDWVLNANYTDKSLLRNIIAYKLGNDLGHYASRTKFFELVINNQYMGIYILQEKIKRDKNRVNIKKMATTDLTGDAVTGGYIVHIDRIDPGDKYFVSSFPSIYPNAPDPNNPSPINYIISYPSTSNLQLEQYLYIKNYINQFETVLSKNTFSDPFDGYYNYIDVDIWADYFLASEFTKATDAYRLSAYFYKDRDSENGKLIYGPMWDYDLSFGLADYNNAWLSNEWVAQIIPMGGPINPPFWVRKIFNDPVMFNKIAKKWHTKKDSIFSPSKIAMFIDERTNYINEASVRNFQKWPDLFNTNIYTWPNKNKFANYNVEVSYLKTWITQRYNWMNANLPSNYSDVEWKQPGRKSFNYKTSETIKLPLNIFYGNTKNISSINFISKNPNISFSLLNDSISISSTSFGEFVFKAIAKQGNNVVSISPEYKIDLTTTNIAENGKLPNNIWIEQNYPNPFNPSTTIYYSVPEKQFVKIEIINSLGQIVSVPVNKIVSVGVNSVNLDLKNHPTGIYFYKISAGSFTEIKKMVLVK